MSPKALKVSATKKPRKASFVGYDRMFQIRMLRVLYQDPDFTTTIGVKLEPTHFERKAHRWLAQQILDYATKYGHGIGRDAIKINLARDLKTGRLMAKDRPELVILIKRLDKEVKDKSFIKEELFRFIKNQTVRDMLMNSLDHLDAHDYDAIDSEIIKVLEVQEATSGGLGHRYVSDVGKRTTLRKTYVKDGVPTGLKLDDHLKPGGLPPRTLGVVVAPTGGGKSHVLVHIGKSAILEGRKKVLHITLELAERDICDRYDATFSRITLNNLETDADKVQDAVKDVGKRYGEFLIVKEFPQATLTVPALRAYIRQLERIAFYPDIIIVDYADEMVPSIITDSAYENQGAVYRELRKLAFELRVPIWTASQTQRSALKKEVIDLDSLADSFKKGMIADVVIALCQSVKEKAAQRARFYVCKNRQGMDKFHFSVKLDWSRSSIRNL